MHTVICEIDVVHRLICDRMDCSVYDCLGNLTELIRQILNMLGKLLP